MPLFFRIKAVAEQPTYHNCVSLCSLCEGEEGTNAIYTSLVSINYRNENQYNAVNFFSLIDILASVSGDCDFWPLKLKDFIGLNFVLIYLYALRYMQLLIFSLIFQHYIHYRTLSVPYHTVYIRATERFMNYYLVIMWK